MAIISQTEQLEMLLAVYDTGSFSAAAKALDCQVAKVSRAVQTLEQQLGCSLFSRTTRRVLPTEEGHRFVAQVRPGLALLAEAESQLRFSDAPAGRLRVDAASPFMLHQLVPLLGEFRTLYPQIELQLMSSENMIDLIEKRTDVAIRIGALTDSNLHARLLGRSPLHLVASPQYLARRGVPQQVSDLPAHLLLGFADNARLNQWPLAAGELLVRPAISASSGETLRQLCLAGHGIALLSNFMIAADLASGSLVQVLPGTIQSPHPREQVHAVYYQQQAVAPRIRCFIDFLASRLQL